VHTLFFTGEVVRFEQRLDLVEHRAINKVRVRTVVFDALPLDLAEVVAVAKHAMHYRFAKWLRREVPGRDRAQTLRLEFFGECP
jgi:hypothetical protein